MAASVASSPPDTLPGTPRKSATTAQGLLVSAEPAASETAWRPSVALARVWQSASSCLASLVFHALLVIALGLWASATLERPTLTGFVASLDDHPAVLDEQLEALEPEDVKIEAVADDPLHQTSSDSRLQADFTAQAHGRAAAAAASPADVQLPQSPVALLSSQAEGDADVTGLLDARLDEGLRARLVEEGGGTPESEDAVSRGLRWLAAHQNRDGSWHFNHLEGQPACTCGNSGSRRIAATTGATGLALLAFLGRGNTHRAGEYQRCVQQGLYYLLSRMKPTPYGGDLQEETMYAHGIATIALAEAYALTRDEELEKAAQQAIDFIVFAQHKPGGGWRYSPHQIGDTTVTGWQLMALKSGQMAYLRVPSETIALATKYLDSVQFDKGAGYYYMKGQTKGAQAKALFPWVPTTVGLLGRMYTGWDKEHPALRLGVERLGKNGPSTDNMYYNYYGTQVMHHWGGEPWQLWNLLLREHLIATQAREGHEHGSWYFPGGHGAVGGRLYNTAVAVMTLEVYYRHLPIYRAEATDGF